jgi:hypothetical protein
MSIRIQKIKEHIFSLMLGLSLTWVLFALVFQVYCVTLEFSGNEEELRRISNELTVRLDGNFSDNPKNIFYKKN